MDEEEEDDSPGDKEEETEWMYSGRRHAERDFDPEIADYSSDEKPAEIEALLIPIEEPDEVEWKRFKVKRR